MGVYGCMTIPFYEKTNHVPPVELHHVRSPFCRLSALCRAECPLKFNTLRSSPWCCKYVPAGPVAPIAQRLSNIGENPENDEDETDEDGDGKTKKKKK